MEIRIELADSTRCIWRYHHVSNHNVCFELVATNTHDIGDIDFFSTKRGETWDDSSLEMVELKE